MRIGLIRKNHNGFTAIELLLTTVVIGILAAVAYPSYTKYIKDAYVTDARAVIGAINAAELVWRQQNGSFTATLNDLNVDTGVTSYFDFAIAGAGNTTYIATATANNDGVGLAVGFSGTDDLTYSYDMAQAPRGQWGGSLTD